MPLATPTIPGHSSFSQLGEDLIVSYIFRRSGISLSEIRYLDIGAALPCGDNNTFLFYQAGSQGVLVEADPEYFPMYDSQRERDLAIHGALVPKRMRQDHRTISFYRTPDRGWSTISKAHLATAKEMGKTEGEIVELDVPALTIAEVIERFDSAYEIDLMSMDIEGVDREILAELNFDVYRPKVIILENTFEPCTGSFRASDTEFFANRGYVLFANTHVNSIFVEKNTFANIRH